MRYKLVPQLLYFLKFKVIYMKTVYKASFISAVAEQIKNNTTGWIGHLPGDNKSITRGQTFVANADGDLETIEVYSNVVTEAGKVFMSVHAFDPQERSWGPVLASASLDFSKTDTGKWLSFHVPGPHLDKGKFYGFKMETNELIGIGEAAGSANQPLTGKGQEWKFSGSDNAPDAYSYFSLAFKVEIRA